MTIASTTLNTINPHTIIADSILYPQSPFRSTRSMTCERLTDLVDFLSKFAWRNLNFFNRSASIMIVIRAVVIYPQLLSDPICTNYIIK